MTLILTQINKYGIIHASDSNVTDDSGQFVRQAKKTFKIPGLKAGLIAPSQFAIQPQPPLGWFIPQLATKRAGRSLGHVSRAPTTDHILDPLMAGSSLSHPPSWSAIPRRT
jgi:hypothetical protein